MKLHTSQHTFTAGVSQSLAQRLSGALSNLVAMVIVLFMAQTTRFTSQYLFKPNITIWLALPL